MEILVVDTMAIVIYDELMLDELMKELREKEEVMKLME